MPDAVGPAEIVEQGEDHQQVAQKRGQHRGANDGLEGFDVEDVNDGAQGETARRQAHAAEDVEADPQAPGKLVAEIGGCAQPLGEAHVGGIQPEAEQDDEHGAPEGQKSKKLFHNELTSFDQSKCGITGYLAESIFCVATISLPTRSRTK